MWYFAWALGLGFALLFALVNTLWLDAKETNSDRNGN
ncbi:MAG: cytochrome bd-I oxidase subunit CydX [Formosimonas sp.]|jgi:cyd operon protein YbgT